MTTETLTPLQQKAADALACFTTDHREVDDCDFTTLKDDAPEWVRALVRKAHGDFLPDDWRYSIIRSAIGYIYEMDDPNDCDAWAEETAVDTYTSDRLAWLASNINRPAYCDQAREEYGEPWRTDQGLIGLIGMGQYVEALEIYSLVLEALSAA